MPGTILLLLVSLVDISDTIQTLRPSTCVTRKESLNVVADKKIRDAGAKEMAEILMTDTIITEVGLCN